VDYGAQDDLAAAARCLATQVACGELTPEEVSGRRRRV
jgi:hypothetical protein